MYSRYFPIKLIVSKSHPDLGDPRKVTKFSKTNSWRKKTFISRVVLLSRNIHNKSRLKPIHHFFIPVQRIHFIFPFEILTWNNKRTKKESHIIYTYTKQEEKYINSFCCLKLATFQGVATAVYQLLDLRSFCYGNASFTFHNLVSLFFIS